MAGAPQVERERYAPNSFWTSVFSPPPVAAQPVSAHGNESLGAINQSKTFFYMGLNKGSRRDEFSSFELRFAFFA